MIINSKITGLTRRSGSNERGEPLREAVSLARPLRCACSPLTSRQERSLAARGLTGDASVVYRSDSLTPAITTGDRITMEFNGAVGDFEVIGHDQACNGAVTHRVLMVKETG